MIDWRRVLHYLVKLRLQQKSTDPSVRLWTVSTEFLIEAGPDDCTRLAGYDHVAVAG